MIVKVDGVKELNALLKKLPKEVMKQTTFEMDKITQDLKGKSQRRAPKDIGTLRKSAFAEVEHRNGSIEATVGYKVPYATRQHEELDYQHINGEAKYLERPLKENIEQYTKSLEKAVKKGFGV